MRDMGGLICMRVQRSSRREEHLRSTILPFAEACVMHGPAPSETGQGEGCAPVAPATVGQTQRPPTPGAPERDPSSLPRSRLHHSHSMPPAGNRGAMRARSLRHRRTADPEADVVHMKAGRGWVGILNPHATQDSSPGRSPGRRPGKAPRAPVRARVHGYHGNTAAHPAGRFGRAGALQQAQHTGGRAVGSMLFKGAPGAPPLPAAAVASLCAPPPPERYQEHLRVAKARRALSEGAVGDASVRSGRAAARIESITGALEMISSTVREAEGSLKQLW